MSKLHFSKRSRLLSQLVLRSLIPYIRIDLNCSVHVPSLSRSNIIDVIPYLLQYRDNPPAIWRARTYCMSIPPRGSHDRLWPSGISRCDPSKPYNTSVAFLTENISGSRGGLLFGLQGRVVDSSSAKITVIRNKVTQFTPTCGSCNDDFSTGDRDQSQISPIMSSGPSEASASPRESHWLSQHGDFQISHSPQLNRFWIQLPDIVAR